jgi:hypothetical protein
MVMDQAHKNMKKLLVLIVLTAFALIPARTEAQSSDIAGLEEYWQQQVDYEIHVTLDTESHTLAGTQTISYKNNSPDTLKVFHLHLYPNAYRERTSPLIRDYMQGTMFFLIGLPGWMRGSIDVTRLEVGGVSLEFTVDGTILTADFPKPLPPGASARIELSFEERIRRKLGRAGYAGKHYDIAQWYPKMAVYDKNGWHPDQFRRGEFYGEFGSFDVHITLPEEYVIAATGVPVSGDPGWDKNPWRGGERGGGRGGEQTGGHPGGHGGGHPGGHPGSTGTDSGGQPAGGAQSGGHPGSGGKSSGHPGAAVTGSDGRSSGTDKQDEGAGGSKTVHFHADNVHDFAWCADPTYVVQDTTHNGYRVMSFFRIWNRSWADSVLARGLRAMNWLESLTGPYPYPQVSIVDSPTHGGMEYPMLCMNGSADESLILHEVGHNYFYGILANDEREEAWLDEGFTQYQTFLHAENQYGPYGEENDRGFPFSLFPRRKMWEGLSASVIRYHRTGFAERVATPSHDFRNSYRAMVYVKSALFLRALHYTVGDETFRKILKTYFDRWKFKHVDEEAFLAVCEEVSGLDLKETFKQWLHTTKDCDYKIDRFKVSNTESGYRAEVRIERKGELMMPLTLAFRFKDGNTETDVVDGFLRTIEKTYDFPSKPVSVAINPNNEILDIYQIDNFAPRKRRLSFDVPFNTYYPTDAFDFRFVPIGFYNDIDGGKAGLRLRGSYDDTYRKFTLQGLYGFESERGDFYGSLEHPLKYFGREAAMRAEGFYREGRQGASLVIDKVRRKYLTDTNPKFLSFWMTYHELTDTSYVFPYTYEEGLNLKAGFSVLLYPKTDLFATSMLFSLDRSFWGSDFNYEKSTFRVRIWPARRYPFPIKPYFRFFLGYSSIDPPLQEMFNLAGAGVLDKERSFWLRSVGAFPKDYYNNFHVPGDGNLRGYFDGDYSFRRLFASNIEVDLPFPLPVGRKLSRMLGRRLYLFYDWGKVMDSKPLEPLPPGMQSTLDRELFDDFLSDFGVGLKLWRFTAEFPVYVSHPELTGDEERWDFRWTIGLESLF